MTYFQISIRKKLMVLDVNMYIFNNRIGSSIDIS